MNVVRVRRTLRPFGLSAEETDKSISSKDPSLVCVKFKLKERLTFFPF